MIHYYNEINQKYGLVHELLLLQFVYEILIYLTQDHRILV